jgi:hypothetical protein
VNLKILITTMGRVHKQLTYDYMPPALKKQAIIVCPPNEAKDHAALGRNILVCTKDGQGLAKKRDWVLQHAWKQGWRYIAMLDDDVVLQRRRKDMRITNATHDEYPLAFEWLEKQLKAGYAHVGWQHRALAFADTGPAMIGTRQMYCLAYDVKKLEKVEATFSGGLPPFASMSDFYMTLQLLTAGLPNIVSLEWRAAPYKSNAPGGCSTYRTKKTIEASARAIAKMFPDFVKLREKKTSWEGVAEQGENRETQTDVTVYWKKALEYGLTNKGGAR